MKTKKLLLTIITLFIVSISFSQNRVSSYRQLKVFNMDTVKYLKSNYYDNNDVFNSLHNKPLSVFFETCEVPLKYFSLRMSDKYVMAIIFYTKKPQTNSHSNISDEDMDYSFMAAFGHNGIVPFANFTNEFPDLQGITDSEIRVLKPKYKEFFGKIKISTVVSQAR